MPVPVTGGVNAGGYTAIVSAGFTRPADTTQYTANDVVSNSTTQTLPLVFKNCVRVAGGSGLLYSALMFDSVAAATKANFDLILFDSAAFTVAVDNSAGTVADNEVTGIVAIITFNGTDSANVSIPGANCVIGAGSIGQAFKCGQSTQDLWGVVVDRGGYTPASTERFDFKLSILQD